MKEFVEILVVLMYRFVSLIARYSNTTVRVALRGKYDFRGVKKIGGLKIYIIKPSMPIKILRIDLRKIDIPNYF